MTATGANSLDDTQEVASRLVPPRDDLLRLGLTRLRLAHCCPRQSLAARLDLPHVAGVGPIESPCERLMIVGAGILFITDPHSAARQVTRPITPLIWALS